MARPEKRSAKTAGSDRPPGAEEAGGEEAPASAPEQVRDLVVVVLVAVALALTLRYLLFEMFVIPSGSMEPTLHGRTDGGDRVLCTKLDYRFRSPRRWEIFVFRYPYEEAVRSYTERGVADAEGLLLSHRGQNFIKRCVALPGEHIGLIRGDLYRLEPSDPAGRGVYRRLSKPDAVQRELWIPVYRESFDQVPASRPEGEGDVPAEVSAFWDLAGVGTLRAGGEGALLLEPGAGLHLAYRPRIRRAFMLETLPGIPDRYVVRQPVRFEDPETGLPFLHTVHSQKIAARSPHSGAYCLESAVTQYGRRSGLPNPDDPPYYTQGDSHKAPRIGQNGYHYVPDLRALVRLRTLGTLTTTVTIELRDDESRLQAVLALDPAARQIRAELREGGRPLPGAPTAVRPADPSAWTDVEFYRADGVARLSAAGELLIEHALLAPEEIPPGDDPEATGVTLSFEGSDCALDEIRIDRDIYYFPGIVMDSEGHRLTVLSPERYSGAGYRTRRVWAMETGEGYLAFGDNCPSSNDSRNWGPVPPGRLQGPAHLLWWPPHRIRLVH